MQLPSPDIQRQMLAFQASREANAFVEHSQSVLFTWQPVLPALASKSPGAAAGNCECASERTAVSGRVPLGGSGGGGGTDEDPLATTAGGGALALNTLVLDRFWAAAGIQLSSSAEADADAEADAEAAASHYHREPHALLPPGGQVALPAFLGEELSSRAMLAAARHYQLRAHPGTNGAAPRIDAVLEHNASVASSLGADRSSLVPIVLQMCREDLYSVQLDIRIMYYIDELIYSPHQ